MATKTNINVEDAVARFESGEGFDADDYRTRSDIAEIEAAVKMRAAAQEMVDQAVIEARREGLTWIEIAAGLGVSPQAARQKYVDRV